MSFDLKVINGDLVIGKNNDVEIVQDSEKLIQDVLKILMTKLGSNAFFPWYGSTLSNVMIGSALDAKFTVSIAENQIRSALETIQNLQREQAGRQKVTPGELLAAIRNIDVKRHPVDPRYFKIDLAILTKALKTVPTSINITI